MPDPAKLEAGLAAGLAEVRDQVEQAMAAKALLEKQGQSKCIEAPESGALTPERLAAFFADGDYHQLAPTDLRAGSRIVGFGMAEGHLILDFVCPLRAGGDPVLKSSRDYQAFRDTYAARDRRVVLLSRVFGQYDPATGMAAFPDLAAAYRAAMAEDNTLSKKVTQVL
jgi:hypothetical protein